MLLWQPGQEADCFNFSIKSMRIQGKEVWRNGSQTNEPKLEDYARTTKAAYLHNYVAELLQSCVLLLRASWELTSWRKNLTHWPSNWVSYRRVTDSVKRLEQNRMFRDNKEAFYDCINDETQTSNSSCHRSTGNTSNSSRSAGGLESIMKCGFRDRRCCPILWRALWDYWDKCSEEKEQTDIMQKSTVLELGPPKYS